MFFTLQIFHFSVLLSLLEIYWGDYYNLLLLISLLEVFKKQAKFHLNKNDVQVNHHSILFLIIDFHREFFPTNQTVFN